MTIQDEHKLSYDTTETTVMSKASENHSDKDEEVEHKMTAVH